MKNTKKIACKGCKQPILLSTAQKYQGYSRQCLAKVISVKPVLQPKKAVKIVKKVKSVVDLEIESEQLVYNLDKQHKEELALERMFVNKRENKANVLKVLDQLCLSMTGQSLVNMINLEVVA